MSNITNEASRATCRRAAFSQMIARAQDLGFDVRLHKLGAEAEGQFCVQLVAVKVIVNWWPFSSAGTIHIDNRCATEMVKSETRIGYHHNDWHRVLAIAMEVANLPDSGRPRQDPLTGKVVDSPSDLLPTANGKICETCGTELIDNCPTCGAPVCCPKCCSDTPLDQRPSSDWPDKFPAKAIELIEAGQERRAELCVWLQNVLDQSATLLAEVDRLRGIAESCAGDLVVAEGVTAGLRTEIDRLHCHERRLKDMLPLFEEARDAIPAIPLTSAKLRNIRLDLADRMDAVGDGVTWKKMDDERQENLHVNGPQDSDSDVHTGSGSIDDNPAEGFSQPRPRVAYGAAQGAGQWELRQSQSVELLVRIARPPS